MTWQSAGQEPFFQIQRHGASHLPDGQDPAFPVDLPGGGSFVQIFQNGVWTVQNLQTVIQQYITQNFGAALALAGDGGGEQGDPGPPGPQGATGATGATGAAGSSGTGGGSGMMPDDPGESEPFMYPPGHGFGLPAIALSTAAASGGADAVIRSDATIAAFDATAPVTQAFGDAAAVGTAAFASRRDHKHGMPASNAGNGFISFRLASVLVNAQSTLPVNSSGVYVDVSNAVHFGFDLDAFLPTHFRIFCNCQASEAANTVTMQLALNGAPATPISAAGNDLVVTNTDGYFDSGWIAWNTPTTSFQHCLLAFKGSNGTVDILYRFIDIMMKK